MKTGSIIISGTEHPLCFSTRVVRNCNDRYGDVSNIADALSSENNGKVLDESLWILAELMQAGERYCRMNGTECAPALTVDDLYDMCDLADLRDVVPKILNTIRDGSSADVNVADSKNVEATPGN